MLNTIKIGIEPSVLKWARISLGFSVDDVTGHFNKVSYKKFKVDKEFIVKMEAEKQEISFRLIQKFAKLYKRPLSAFFLTKPPKEYPLPKDFRTMSSSVNTQLTRDSMLMIRRARRVQDVTRELYDDLGIEYKFNFTKYDIKKDDPSEVAREIRKKLGFTIETQRNIKKPGELFEYLRGAIEASGVIVLKGSFPLKDARAFSFVDKKPYVIVINNKDGNEIGFTPKIFSLAHEFAHVLLRESSICNDFVLGYGAVEKFCNQFAGEFLIPQQLFLEIIPIQNKNKINQNNIDEYIKQLKNIFKVSGQVVLRRMLSLGYVSQDFYESTTHRWQNEFDEEAKSKGNNFVPHISKEQQAVNNYGKLFTKLVLEAQFSNKITTSSAAEYLSIKARNMPNLYDLALAQL